MSGRNKWNDVLGPFYSAEGLERRGIEVSPDLIDLHTADGGVIYPHAQFDVDGDTLQRREAVLGLWNQLIRLAIQEGCTDEWSATILLLQETDQHPSEASVIARDPSKIEEVAADIKRILNRWRQ